MMIETAPEMDANVRSFLAEQKLLYIGGEWSPPSSGAFLQSINPADESVLCEFAAGDSDDIERAVQSARKAFEHGPWPRMAPSERAKHIWELASLIEEDRAFLAELETLDCGKPFSATYERDLPAVVENFRYMAGWATKLHGTHVPVGPAGSYHAFTRREPAGVVGLIVPWNSPLYLTSNKIAPALAAGCTIILKPAEQTPLSALRLAELAGRAGIPDGVVNVITGTGREAGAALVRHRGIDKVSFTGSTAVGREIVSAAAGNLKRVSLELGGKSPNIVFPDADLDRAIPGAARAIFNNAGQVCSAGSRLFVHESQVQDIVDGVSDFARKLKMGHGMARETELGPLISAPQLERVQRYIHEGVADGARVAYGGRRVADTGYFMEPTVFVDTRPEMSIVQEEIFGPVLSVSSYATEEELIAQVNNAEYGLAAGIWTRDVSRAHRVAERIRAGSVWINGYGGSGGAALPTGGFRASGWGRELGWEGLVEYTEVKTVVITL